MSRMRSILAGASMLLLFATLGISADESWSLSKLNPFSKTTSTTTKPNTNGRKAAPPSTWSKVTSGTKNALTKTNQAINPWAKKTPQSSRQANAKQAANRPKEPEKKSVLSGLWSKPEEPKKPKTVSEFLSQPRPQ